MQWYTYSSLTAWLMRRFLTTVLACTSVTACGDGDPFSPASVDDPVSPESVAGFYDLQSLDGGPLPFETVAEDGMIITTTASSISLEEGCDFIWIWSFDPVGSGCHISYDVVERSI